MLSLSHGEGGGRDKIEGRCRRTDTGRRNACIKEDNYHIASNS